MQRNGLTQMAKIVTTTFWKICAETARLGHNGDMMLKDYLVLMQMKMDLMLAIAVASVFHHIPQNLLI